MAWVAAATIGGSIVGGMIQGDAAKRAAGAQADAANRATDIQNQQYQQSRLESKPYREAGLSALDFMMGRNRDYSVNQEKITGLEDRLKGIKAGVSHWQNLVNSGDGIGSNQWKTNLESHLADQADVEKQIADLQSKQSTAAKSPAEIAQEIMTADPGYQFRLDQGNKAINAAAAARGRAVSGAAMKELGRYGQDYSSQEYGNAYNRLAQMAGIGQSVNQQNAQLGLNYSNMAGNNAMSAGNAAAAGIVGQGNAMSDALGQGANSWMQYNMMNKMFKNPSTEANNKISLGSFDESTGTYKW